MNGRIYTFYSWKGGVGRTMALANVGVQLARRGKRVLLVDWDLEAPGLDRYFQPLDAATASQLSVKAATDRTGLMGLLDHVAEPGSSMEVDAWRRRCAQVGLPPLPPSLRTGAAAPSPQPLHVLGSGLGSPDYAARLQAFSWEAFFVRNDGGQLLETLRDQWRDAYDFVLIDSRTGLTDSGGVCTVQMPDALVFVFTANTQSLDDGLAFLNGVHSTRTAFAFERPPLTVIPLLARWEGDREVDLADSWLDRMAPLVEPLVETWLPSDLPIRRMLERLRVPHVARFSFGEPLPVLTHSLSDPDRPGLAYELLAELLAGGFASAGEIIEPGYRPSFNLEHATDAEIDALVLDDQARDAAVNQVRETHGSDSLPTVDLLIELAKGGLRVGRTVLADEWAKAAVSKARNRARERPDDVAEQTALALALTVQGDVRKTLGSMVDALFAYRESLAVARRVADADPSNLDRQRDVSLSLDRIGDVQRAQGDLFGGLASYRESLAVAMRLVEADPSNAGRQRDLSVSLNKIGNVQSVQGDLSGALASFRESLATRRRLADTDPSNAGRQRDLSVSLSWVGDAQSAQGDLSGALGSYRESLALARRLAEADPSNAGRQRDLGVSLAKVGDVQSAQGDPSGALASYGESLMVARRLADADPSNAGWQRDVSVGLSWVGDAQSAQGDLSGALASYRESLAVTRRLAEADPSNADLQRDLGVSLNKIGDVQSTQGDLSGALASYDDSLAATRSLAEADPSNADWQRDLSLTLTCLAEIHSQQGNVAAAMPLAQESLLIDERLSALDPTNVVWKNDVVVSRALVERLQATK